MVVKEQKKYSLNNHHWRPDLLKFQICADSESADTITQPEVERGGLNMRCLAVKKRS